MRHAIILSDTLLIRNLTELPWTVMISVPLHYGVFSMTGYPFRYRYRLSYVLKSSNKSWEKFLCNLINMSLDGRKENDRRRYPAERYIE